MKQSAAVCSLFLLPLLFLADLGGTSGLRFRPTADDWGVEFRHHQGSSGEFYMPETMGSGLVMWDYDEDGDQDLFFVDSGPLPGYTGPETGSSLYRNDGGRFVEVTVVSGIDVDAYGMGATAGDVDGDRFLDLYVTAFGANQLFRNRGDGTFRDVTSESGVGDESWGASTTFTDTDRDGDLDLYVTNYVDFTLETNEICGDEERGLRSYCHPDVYDGLPDVFYRNRGDGTFVVATEQARLGAADGKGLGVVSGDVDGDDWSDLYVANDMTPNFLFVNRGDGTFRGMGLAAGTAVGDQGQPEAGMGVDLGDLDGDARPDIMVTHLDLQTNAVYSNLGSGLFVDRRFMSRLAEPSMLKVGFGLVFGDLDHDGDLDVVVANGHIIHNVDQWGVGSTYRQRNQIFENSGSGEFQEVPDAGLSAARVSRGLAAGDLDGDGDLDLAVSNSGGPAEIYENRTAGAVAANRLALDFEGHASNRFGLGAQVRVESNEEGDEGRHQQIREVRAASSYLSQNALTLHFGLGKVSGLERLTVRWPSGKVQEFTAPPPGRRIRISEGTSARSESDG